MSFECWKTKNRKKCVECFVSMCCSHWPQPYLRIRRAYGTHYDVKCAAPLSITPIIIIRLCHFRNGIEKSSYPFSLQYQVVDVKQIILGPSRHELRRRPETQKRRVLLQQDCKIDRAHSPRREAHHSNALQIRIIFSASAKLNFAISKVKLRYFSDRRQFVSVRFSRENGVKYQ